MLTALAGHAPNEGPHSLSHPAPCDNKKVKGTAAGTEGGRKSQDMPTAIPPEPPGEAAR
jgi:hypothetical protein